jgi:hypothetical protein
MPIFRESSSARDGTYEEKGLSRRLQSLPNIKTRTAGVYRAAVAERLAPHLRRSATLGLHIDGYASIRNAAFDGLDRFSDGVVILDRNGSVLFANSTARALDSQRAVRLRHHGVLAPHSQLSIRSKDLGRLSDAGFKSAATAAQEPEPPQLGAPPVSTCLWRRFSPCLRQQSPCCLRG